MLAAEGSNVLPLRTSFERLNTMRYVHFWKAYRGPMYVTHHSSDTAMALWRPPSQPAQLPVPHPALALTEG